MHPRLVQQIRLIFAMAFLVFLSACAQDKNVPAVSPVSVEDQQLPPLDMLKEGNKRFVQGEVVHPNLGQERIRELLKGQHPSLVVVSCSDSRVPPELIFDRGLGDIFSVRTAGNIMGDFELASVEYAVEHLGVKVVVVLGHHDCGAVKAYLSDTLNRKSIGHIRDLVDYIRKEAEEKAIPVEERNNLSLAVYANILHGMHTLKKSTPVLKDRYEKKEINIIGGLYNIENGKVSFVEEN